MTNPAADDRHYPAALYELVHRGTAGDLSFYRRVCQGGERVLELGCGYGRVLAALCEQTSTHWIGLERDPELLDRARARLPAEVELLHGDMRDFALDGPPCDRILIPHSGFYCLDDAGRNACLRACAAHLAPGGRLVFDAWSADAFHTDTDPADLSDDHLDPVVSVEHEGTCYDVFERSEWHRDDQRIEVVYEYIPRGGGEAAVGRLVHHYVLQDQLSAILGAAGLELASLASDWRDTPPAPDANMWVATAVRAAP